VENGGNRKLVSPSWTMKQSWALGGKFPLIEDGTYMGVARRQSGSMFKDLTFALS
jgi:hypothetical protein